jgi:CubicO group peptidase (beta-lactamase class C family)
MEKYIFDPLGMRSMTVSVLTPEHIRSKIPVLAHRVNGTNRFSSSPPMWLEPLPDDCGGIGLYGSAEDFMAFLEMLLQIKGGVWWLDTAKEMLTPQLHQPEYLTPFIRDTNLKRDFVACMLPECFRRLTSIKFTSS